MPLFGQCFLSDVLKKPVLDRRGDVAGRLKDILVVKGEPLAKVSAILVTRDRRSYLVPWHEVEMFNRRILSIRCEAASIQAYELADEDLLAVRDILDKQIVDANGAKVVRVNDVRLEGYNGEAVLTAADVGVRGLLRRLGVERRSEQFFGLLKVQLPLTLISWQYIQPLSPKLKTLALTVPRQMVAALHPADLAEILSQVSRDEGRSLLTELDVKTAAGALSELESEQQVQLIAEIDAEKAADIIEEMPPDEASDVLGDLPADKAKEILDRIEDEEAEDIQELLGYEEHSAGGLMTTEFIAYPSTLTAAEAIQRFKERTGRGEPTYQVYAIGADDKFVGVVALRSLLIAESTEPLHRLIERRQRTVPPDVDGRHIATLMSEYNLIALPVVGGDGRLLGVVTIDDVIDRLLPAAVRKKRKA